MADFMSNGMQHIQFAILMSPANFNYFPLASLFSRTWFDSCAFMFSFRSIETSNPNHLYSRAHVTHFFVAVFFLNKYPGFIMCVRHMNWLSAGREVEKYIPNIKPKNIFILRIFAVFVPFIDTFLFQRDDEWCQIKTGINGRKKVMCF